MMKSFAAIVAALAIAATPVSSALAYDQMFAVEERAPATPQHDWRGHAIEGFHLPCAPSSSSQGNANQQNFPVQQYGQTSGGAAC